MLHKGKAWLKVGLIIVLLLMAGMSFAAPLPGDLDGDGDVDRDDLNIILGARGETATGPDDPRDLDGDGEITGLDSRVLVTLCTRPRCETEPADTTPPQVSITSPANDSKTSETSIVVIGNASDETELTGVTVNGVAAKISGVSFSATVELHNGANTITAVATDAAGNTASSRISVTRLAPLPPPTISSFSPTSASIGDLLTITGTNFAAYSEAQPTVSLTKQGGGTVNAPVASFDATTVTITIPASAATGPVGVTVDDQSVTSASALTIIASSDFTLTAAPTNLDVIQGKSAGLSVSVGTTSNFAQLVKLSVSGLPSDVTASFEPEQVAAGQISLLTITTPANQPVGTHSLTVSGTATVDGIDLNHSTAVALNIETVTTSFLGRTVVANAEQTPLVGVTITMLGKDGDGNATQCTGTTTSDAAGNFTMTNLPDGCAGPQLIRYDGSTVTSPTGEYAGVDLIYTLVANQVTESPVLVHLPRIDDGETVNVVQNHTLDQTFRFSTIPNLSMTVYAGTTLSMKDGEQPDPFPLTAVEVPVDRLPEEMPPSDELSPFIVAFQPANAQASQPIAVTFPNLVNTPPGTNVTLTTLDPTKGVMVAYGTGTVSDDGLKVVPDPDPEHPGHRYGLVHFDWHGPTGPRRNQNDPCPNGPCGGDPVHFSSGLVIDQRTDLAMPAPGGGFSIQRTYRTMSANAGPFGIGWNHNYSYSLSLSNPSLESRVINFIVPAGNQFPMTNNGDGVFTNTSEPSLRGAALTINDDDGTVDLIFRDGTKFHFIPGGLLGSVLQSITDPNGNTTTLVRNIDNLLQITEIIDSVGRKLQLSYDGNNRITEILDPIGRTVSYTYTSSGSLGTVTDPEGGVTRYIYARVTSSSPVSQLTSITDARGIVVARNFYGLYYGPACNGNMGLSDDDLALLEPEVRSACLDDPSTVRDERIWKQIAADGGEMHFRYTIANQRMPLSPVIQTAVTDAMGYTTTYRFSTQGYTRSVIDPVGQMMVFDRESGTNRLLVKRGNATCAFCGDTSNGDSQLTRDENGNILTSTDMLGNSISLSYDLRFNKPISLIDALGQANFFNYDDKGNLLSATDAKDHKTVLKYDSRGLPVETVDPLGNKTQLEYDAMGNLIRLIDSLGNTAQFGYDSVGRLVEAIDAQNRRSKIVYDNLNRVVTQINGKDQSTAVRYDAVGNLLSVTDAEGHSIAFTYDTMNRVATRTDAAGRSESFEYDLNGNLIKSTDRRGQTTAYTYDDLDRLVTIHYADGNIIGLRYDTRNRVIRIEDTAGGTQSFQYDVLGRLISETAPNGSINYQYDALGRIISRQVVGQTAVTYTYDAVGNIVSVSDANASVNFSYDALDRRTTLQRGNGVVTNQDYDELSRVLAINHSHTSGVIDHQAYAYDKTGSRASLANTLGEAYTTQPSKATYDEANRLLTQGDFSYTYDENGNRLTKTGPSGTTHYSWDSRNRLTTIGETDGAVTHFVYDAFNQLISQQVTGSITDLETRYLADLSSNVVHQASSDGEVLSILTGLAMDDHLAVTRNEGASAYILRDAINSTVALTDSSGALQQSISYEPYGQTSRVTTTFPIQYTGRLPVSDSLYYYRSRFYDSKAGLFLNEDTIGLRGGINLYGYTEQNPLIYTDPTGEFLIGMVATVHWTRNYWMQDVTDLSDVNSWTELGRGEDVYHRQGEGNDGNRKFVSEDGHHEAVFTVCGKLVTDSRNRGSFNFFGPRSHPWLHTIFDVLPYIALGNTPRDMFRTDRFKTTGKVIAERTKRRYHF